MEENAKPGGAAQGDAERMQELLAQLKELVEKYEVKR